MTKRSASPHKLPTLAQLAAALSNHSATSLGLTDTALQRAVDPDGEGTRVFTCLYAEKARAAAKASDGLRSAGHLRSPLEGLPISIKDLFDVAGEITLAASPVREGEAPAPATALAIQRLIAAGAIIVGRTNMTEFAFSGLGLNPHHGTPLNRWQRASGRIPGGSSSGAAVSVTDGMAAAAIGTDTGGSVRIPAALCGLTGFKPTARRIPMDGVLPLSPSLDSVGPIAPSVACCALLDAILAGEAPQPLAPPDLHGVRLAIPTTLVFDGIDGEVAAAFEASVACLQAAGASIERIAVPEFAELATINAKGGLVVAEAYAWHKPLIDTVSDRYDPRVLSRLLRGRDVTAAEVDALHAARRTWIAAVEKRLEGFDALLLPTVPVVAPSLAVLQGDDAFYSAANLLMLRNPTLINFLDGCALSLPCQLPGGAPVGLMLAGPGGSDRRILNLGQAVETALAQRTA